jgi:hypothetical protein
MKIRKMLLLVMVLTVLIAGATLPAVADPNNAGKGQDKKPEVTSGSSAHDPKLNASPSATVTPTAAPTVHANDARTKAEKAQADKNIRVTLNQIDAYIKWVKNSRLPESEKAALISQANADKDWYLQMGASINATMDRNDLQGKVSQFDQRNGELKAELKKSAGLLACDDVTAKIETARSVSVIAAEKIAAEKANGKDTARMEQLLASYNSHVDAAATHTSTAKAYFTSITGAADSNQLFGKGYGELKQADAQLTLAYNDLKNIYRLLYSSQ